MKTRYFAFYFGLVVLSAGVVGCETGHGLLRKPKVEDSRESTESTSAIESDASKIQDVSSDKPKPFFKASRLTGAMSDEGREIEKDLGIH